MLLGNRGSGPYRVPLSLGPLLVRGAVDLALQLSLALHPGAHCFSLRPFSLCVMDPILLVFSNFCTFC